MPPKANFWIRPCYTQVLLQYYGLLLLLLLLLLKGRIDATHPASRHEYDDNSIAL